MLYEIIIVDDSPVDSIFLKKWIESIPNFSVFRVFNSSHEFLSFHEIGANKDFFLVIDFYMPLMNGIELLDCIKNIDRKRVMIVSNGFPGDVDFLKRARISNFSEKSRSKFLQCLKNLTKGIEYIDYNFLDKFKHNYVSLNDSFSSDKKISQTEIEIVNLLSCGMDYTEISNTIGTLTIRSVETYVQNIKRRLELKSNCQLIKWAMVQGLIYYFDDLKSK
jgi:DNA-binding NarL/FixJ family response regulator